jgi:hypothetical protein
MLKDLKENMNIMQRKLKAVKKKKELNKIYRDKMMQKKRSVSLKVEE